MNDVINELNNKIDHDNMIIKGLLEENRILKNILESIKNLDLYEFELDYDYEEEPISNYYPFNMEEYINSILEEEKMR